MRKKKLCISLLALIICATVSISCAANPEGLQKAPEIKDLYGHYAFEETVYIWPLSSYIPMKENMPTYTLDNNGLTIKEPSGSETFVRGVFVDSEFDEAEFKACFSLDVGIPDISGYKSIYVCSINENNGDDPLQNPIYRIYLMDAEIWLAELHPKTTSEGPVELYSIYKLRKTAAIQADNAGENPIPR